MKSTHTRTHTYTYTHAHVHPHPRINTPTSSHRVLAVVPGPITLIIKKRTHTHAITHAHVHPRPHRNTHTHQRTVSWQSFQEVSPSLFRTAQLIFEFCFPSVKYVCAERGRREGEGLQTGIRFSSLRSSKKKSSSTFQLLRVCVRCVRFRGGGYVVRTYFPLLSSMWIFCVTKVSHACRRYSSLVSQM